MGCPPRDASFVACDYIMFLESFSRTSLLCIKNGVMCSHDYRHTWMCWNLVTLETHISMSP